MGQSSIQQPTLQRIREWIADYSIPLNLFFVSRLGLFLLVYLSMVILPMADNPNQFHAHPDNRLLDGWARWDSGWYMGIAEHGYSNEIIPAGQDTAFFPMYSLLIRLVYPIVGDFTVSGLLISNVSFLLAIIVLFRLLSDRYGTQISERTLALICFGAFSFFFSAVYTESVFLLAVVCAFYFCEREKYLWAALWGAAAGATRVLGIAIIIPLVVLYLEQRDYDWRRIRPNILVLSISLLGTFSYMAFLAVKFGNVLQFLTSQAAWQSLNPTERLINSIDSLSLQSVLIGDFQAMNLIHLFVFLIFLVLVLAYWRKVGLPYALFSIIGLVSSLSLFHGMGRYIVVIFPLFVAAAFFLKNKSLFHLVLYINVLFLALFSIMFSHWYWVA